MSFLELPAYAWYFIAALVVFLIASGDIIALILGRVIASATSEEYVYFGIKRKIGPVRIAITSLAYTLAATGGQMLMDRGSLLIGFFVTSIFSIFALLGIALFLYWIFTAKPFLRMQF